MGEGREIMTKKAEHLSRLLYRKITGCTTDDDDRQLQEWLAEDEANRQLLDELADMGHLETEYRRRKAVDAERAMNDMYARIGGKRKSRRRTIALRLVEMAAVAVLTLGIYTIYQKHWQAQPTTNVEAGGVRIVHGSTKATLKIDNGDAIQLCENPEKNRQLLAAASASTATEQPRQCELETPRGGEFKIMLEDSTEVWLNASSRLVYPESFGDKERRVAVVGEAYFKVAKDASRPFYVEADGEVIRVYGTEFNVNNYPEDSEVSTTLVSGSIALRQAMGNSAELVLTPGRQALFEKASATTRVRNVDTDVVTSWREGRFVFEDQTLEQIMRTLSRWYDFDYEFSDSDVAQVVFMGSIPRYGSFDEVVEIFEKMGGIRLRQKGEKVVISAK